MLVTKTVEIKANQNIILTAANGMQQPEDDALHAAGIQQLADDAFQGAYGAQPASGGVRSVENSTRQPKGVETQSRISEQKEQNNHNVQNAQTVPAQGAFAGTGVTLEISDAVKQMYQEQAEKAKESGDAFEDMAKLMEIARRIARGDRVPGTDEQKLMEFSMELYQVAKQAALVNAGKKHKEYGTMFDDEEEKAKRDKLRQLGHEDNGQDDLAEGSSMVENATAEIETGR